VAVQSVRREAPRPSAPPYCDTKCHGEDSQGAGMRWVLHELQTPHRVRRARLFASRRGSARAGGDHPP
jgi:hypothetical protein